MEYRLARNTDLHQLAQMRWDYWVEGGSDPAKQEKLAFVDGFVEDFATILNKDWYAWCAVDGDVILSHVYVQQVRKVPKPSAPTDAFGYVTNVYTRPPHRNSGVGSQLMEHVKSWAHESDLEFLVLWPSEASIPFWQRNEFSVGDPFVLEIRPYVN